MVYLAITRGRPESRYEPSTDITETHDLTKERVLFQCQDSSLVSLLASGEAIKHAVNTFFGIDNLLKVTPLNSQQILLLFFRQQCKLNDGLATTKVTDLISSD